MYGHHSSEIHISFRGMPKFRRVGRHQVLAIVFYVVCRVAVFNHIVRNYLIRQRSL